jgi:RNA binding exosome subunit
MRPVRAVLRVFVYGTEDEPRVRAALLWVTGRKDDADGRGSLTRSKIKGHYGTEIAFYEAVVKRNRELKDLLARWSEADELIETLRDEFQQRLDEDRTLHFRLDKQAAVLGRLEVGTGGDTIQVAVKYEKRSDAETGFPFETAARAAHNI